MDYSQSAVLTALEFCRQQGMIRPLDLEFARFLWQQEMKQARAYNSETDTLRNDILRNKAELIAKYGALVSLYLGKGHVCLNLSALNTISSPFLNEDQSLPEETKAQVLAMLELDLEQELEQLMACVSLSKDADKPLVLEQDVNSGDYRLYLNRYWHYEQLIADYIEGTQSFDVNLDVMRDVLVELFPTAESAIIDYQKLAAGVALTSPMSVITGGPGTGKTYTVVRLLASLIQYNERIANQGDEIQQRSGLTIKLAAPTGKAAARMLESIRNAVDSLPLTDDQKAAFPETASTLHRLLGSLPLNANFKHDRKNPLHLDILIVDEASMIDLPMMAKLLDAMPKHGRLVLLGDRDQLASVEAGAVLNDLCQNLGGYSDARAAELSHLTGYTLDIDPQANAGSIQDSLAWLKVSRRFGADSGIGHLANAINQGDADTASHYLFDQKFADINAQPLSQSSYKSMLNQVCDEYAEYFSAAQRQEYQVALECFSNCRLLCALREGDYGVSGLNLAIQQRLIDSGIINNEYTRLNDGSVSEWYVGRPVMVLRNEHSLSLYNGDIGIVMKDETGRLRVYFESSDGLLAVLPSRMPEHETAYAMTVHKSQGSEFAHTVLITPDRLNPVLTRELIYTGVTRAKKKLSLLYDAQVFKEAVGQRVERFSGLAQKLNT